MKLQPLAVVVVEVLAVPEHERPARAECDRHQNPGEDGDVPDVALDANEFGHESEHDGEEDHVELRPLARQGVIVAPPGSGFEPCHEEGGSGEQRRRQANEEFQKIFHGASLWWFHFVPRHSGMPWTC